MFKELSVVRSGRMPYTQLEMPVLLDRQIWGFTRIGNHYEHNLSGVSSSLNHRDDYLSFRAVSSKAGCQPHKVLVEQPSESSDGSVTLAKVCHSQFRIIHSVNKCFQIYSTRLTTLGTRDWFRIMDKFNFTCIEIVRIENNEIHICTLFSFCAFINTNPVIAHKNHNSRVFNTMDKFRSNNESVRHPALRGASEDGCILPTTLSPVWKLVLATR